MPDELQLDPDHRATPIDFGDVCVNYDRGVLPAAPSMEDLTEPALAGQLVVQNPATSSPGLAVDGDGRHEEGEAG